MKKTIKKLISLVVVFTMMLAMAVPVGAATKTKVAYSKKETIIVMPYDNIKQTKPSMVLAQIKGKKPTNVKTSNPSIGKVKAERVTYLAEPTYNITLYYQKYGTTTVSFKCDGKTYKTKVLVHKYVNPVSSIKIGNTTIKGSKFNDGNMAYYLKKTPYANKSVKVDIKMKSGWKLVGSLNYNERNKPAGIGYNNKIYKNGSKIKILKKTSLTANCLAFKMEHTKTGKQAEIYVYFQ